MNPVKGPPATQLPPAATSGEVAPKRGPGRPKGARTRNDAPSKSTLSLETRIGGMLVIVNTALYLVPPLRADALDPIEIAALAKAIDSQARQSPRFRKYIEAALAAGSGGQLLGVCAIIGARRAARHGVLPSELDGHFGALLAQTAPPMPPAPPAVQAEVMAHAENGTGS